ncbi:MAG: helical backbone metal receptor [Endomicrobium sp.]|jgi:iron complex transport system substrate-binding protein|nr:helical backbone metal receptor [Endomicrobium sp.]
MKYEKIFFIFLFLLLSPKIICNAKEYKCIISLSPLITKSLYELGLEQFTKGITIYCSKGTIKKEFVGTLLEIDIEKIMLLKPDIVISTKDGNNKITIEKLKRLGLEVYIMEIAKNFNEICINYNNLAKKLNKEKEAKKIVNTARNLLWRNYNKRNCSNNLKVFWEIGKKPLCTTGKQSFINDYNYFTNTINIYENINKRYFFVDIENVIERNPDIIFVVNVDNDIQHLKNKKWHEYKKTKAVKNNKIFTIDTNIFIYTPLTFAKNVITLTKTIYGEI